MPRTISQWFAARRLRRRFREIDQHSIGTRPEDTLGRLSGIARPLGDAMQAPLSGRSCLYRAIDIIEDHGFDWPMGVIGVASMLCITDDPRCV